MTPLVGSVTNFLSYLIVLSDILAAFLFIILVTPLKNRGGGKKIADFFGDNGVLFAFLIAAASVGGSLFFSQVAQFQPCLLCWLQRVLLYPQVLILLAALITKRESVKKYCLALSWAGVLLSTYHTYLQFGGTAIGNCDVGGVSCEHVYFLKYGYVTIPTMALTAFVLIILFLSFKKRRAV